MTKSKREELGQIVIRPPEGMRERIKAAAAEAGRSMNAEIVNRLEWTFENGSLTNPLFRTALQSEDFLQFQRARDKWLISLIKLQMAEADLRSAEHRLARSTDQDRAFLTMLTDSAQKRYESALEEHQAVEATSSLA